MLLLSMAGSSREHNYKDNMAFPLLITRSLFTDIRELVVNVLQAYWTDVELAAVLISLWDWSSLSLRVGTDNDF